jgi:plasmid maintenance system antidote protein VapI
MNKNEYQITATTRGGQLLQKTMKERQLTFREVGDAVGVTHTNVHHWITRRVPMLRWAVRLKELYGIPVEAWMKEI